MAFDLVYLLILALAAWNGFQKGLVLGFFSLIAVVIGLAAALKLSVVASRYIGSSVSISERWLPLVSFVLVFLAVLLLIRLGAKAIEKLLQIAMLGWLNRLGGVLLFAAIYTIVFSILVFYAVQMQLVSPESSVTFPFVHALGPRVIEGLGSVLPLFRDMFAELQEFFGRVANSQQ